MNKLIITRWNSRVLTALVSEKTTIELGLADTSSVLGNIYIGKVKKIVRNLNSAFVDFSDGCTGYYSLTDNKVTLFADGHERKLKEGDEIIVQVAKDARSSRRFLRVKTPASSSAQTHTDRKQSSFGSFRCYWSCLNGS